MAKKDEITKNIIEAGIQEFMAKGLDSASMESIAKVAQVSKRTLYKYFPSKESIFDALIEELLNAFCGFTPVVYSKTESLEEQIKKIVDIKVELLTSENYINISKLVLSEVLKSKKLDESHIQKFYESEAVFLKWIDAAKKDGKITSKQPSDLISNQVHSIVKGQLFYPVLFGVKKISKQDIKMAKKTTVEFFLNSFCR